jgi:1-acyl-sn-glycerol-3-phosphate acyltransferase
VIRSSGDVLRRLSEVGLVEFIGEQIDESLEDPAFQRDPDFLKILLPLMELFNRYFDSEVRGFENVPEQGPMLLVGNHSGGVLVPDTTAVISAWYRERGLDSALVGLAFDAVFAVPGMKTLMRRLGEIPANPENAAEALDAGAAILVYPGGAHEAFRPWTERNRIDFGGHKGFVRLALRKRVPVVPVVGHGGHETTIVLTRGEGLAKYLGMERLRLRIAPLLLQVPWGLSVPIVPGIPLPAKITVQICPPLDWSQLGPEAADDPQLVDRCYEEITGVMQEALTRLAEERPLPVVSRLWSLLPGSGGDQSSG